MRTELCRWVCGLTVCCALPCTNIAQDVDSTQVHRGRAWAVGGGAGVLAVGSLIALDQAWYADHDRGPFHFFDDSGEWLQMDKAGHAWTTYTLASYGHAAFRWAGMPGKRSVWIGGSLGWAYLVGIEYLDGRSSEWGFSWSDMAANTFGTGLFIAQQIGWKEQRIGMKYSAHLTDYAPQRPDVLGSSTPERILKDYNGATVWLSGNLRSFGCEGLPSWLNLAMGYGAEGMLSAHDPAARRQFYFAPDIALSRIPVKSKLWRTVFFVLDRVKVPLPTLEVREGGTVKGHWLYF